ncbi:MAG: hypothetical protein A2Y12_01350 [Planctomycetes bacterium GWF2_42_9]|nr:MAG: hypothetical protein A2Y12_01350 [Planctomycetes bacterium GWF2_42_9]
MANSTALNIADAVVETLKTITYNDSALPAVRSLFPFYELKELKTLKISVVPRAVACANFDRSASEFNYEIDIAVQKAVASTNDVELEQLMNLVLTIAKTFRRKVYANLGGASCFKQDVELISAEHIQPPPVFTSVITLHFKVIE